MRCTSAYAFCLHFAGVLLSSKELTPVVLASLLSTDPGLVFRLNRKTLLGGEHKPQFVAKS